MLLAIFVGGVVAGLCDLVFAVVYYGASWPPVAHHIAAGLIGLDASLGGGLPVVVLGTFLHFTIALGAAAVFVVADRWLKVLGRFPGPAGLVYGIVVYFVMNWIVVPLSAVAGKSWPPRVDWGAVVGHMVLIGLPIALTNRWLGPGTRRVG